MLPPAPPPMPGSGSPVGAVRRCRLRIAAPQMAVTMVAAASATSPVTERWHHGGVLSFLRSPKWVIGTLLAVIGAAVFTWCGFWQLRRLDEVRTYNATFSSRLSEAPVDLTELLAQVRDDESLAYRRVTVSGTYRTGEETLWSTVSYEGTPGHHVLTPLETSDGAGVIVDRGWVPLELDTPPVAQAQPAEGEVTVSGVLFPSQDDARFTPEPGEGRLPYVRRVDLPRLQEQVGVELAPVYVLAQESSPAAVADLPLPGALPVLDEGSHASYAVQWFVFATVVAVGWPVLIGRTARDRAQAAGADRDEPRRERVGSGAGTRTPG